MEGWKFTKVTRIRFSRCLDRRNTISCSTTCSESFHRSVPRSSGIPRLEIRSAESLKNCLSSSYRSEKAQDGFTDGCASLSWHLIAPTFLVGVTCRYAILEYRQYIVMLNGHPMHPFDPAPRQMELESGEEPPPATWNRRRSSQCFPLPTYEKRVPNRGRLTTLTTARTSMC